MCPAMRRHLIELVLFSTYAELRAEAARSYEKVVELELNADERAMFDKSLASVKKTVEETKL